MKVTILPVEHHLRRQLHGWAIHHYAASTGALRWWRDVYATDDATAFRRLTEYHDAVIQSQLRSGGAMRRLRRAVRLGA